MPVGLESRFKRHLKEIVTVLSGIRNTALDYANEQNFSVYESLGDQLDTIRTSADAILRAFAKASLTSYCLDDRIADWLASGELQSCLGKLKEMNDILRPIDSAGHPAPSHTPAEDKLSEAMTLFNTHKSLFHFLLTRNVWNCDQSETSQVEAPPITNVYVSCSDTPASAYFLNEDSSMTTGHEDGPLLVTDHATETNREKALLRQKLDEISRWLTPMECTQKHNDALRVRQKGTCKWFPNTDVYQKWRTPGSRFLWLHGKAGCGKSVLIAFTIEYLKNRLEEGEVVVFFYCDFQNKRSTSSMELMRSLLSQLLGFILDRGVDPGDFPDKILKLKTKGTLSPDDFGKLCDLVSQAASFFRYEPMIVIDALDECADIEVLLPALVTLSQSDVRLLVTSRPEQTIADHFAGLQSLSFEDVAEEIAADIALHVRRELDSYDRLRSAIPGMKNEMHVKLTERAEGRFRWAQCQLDTLKRCATEEDLRKVLDSLPNELGATYERILGEIDERKSEGELARRVLALLMVALEPLQLSQIIDGLSMDFQKQAHHPQTQKWLETKLIYSLSSLVSYDERTDVLALSHYSVNEYLTSRSALPMYQTVTHKAHAEAVQMCMGYITVYLTQESSHSNLDRFPMIFYVLSSGFSHLAYVDSESSIALGALQSLGSDVRHHPSHWDRLCELREETLEWPYALWPSSKHDIVLYILIAYSPPGLLRTFLSSSRLSQPRIRTNPLVYAADLRKTEHAMVLLAYGSDVNARGLVIDDSHCASPLEVAIDLGDDVLVGELLQRGCLVSTELLATAVCMPWCSTRVLVKLMQTDEFVEWALEIGDERLYRGVFSSARPNAGDSRKTDEDHVALARRLSQLGLCLSPDSQFGKVLIERALYAAHTSMLDFLLPPHKPPPAEFLITASTGDTPETVPVVRFLLQRGIDVHPVSSGGDTALHLAAMCPWEPRSLELTKLLIHAGSNSCVHNSDGETPLVVAVRRGHCSVVDLLLSYNAPLPADILHRALERRQNLRMIKLLLRRGADVYTLTQFGGNTILHLAIIEPALSRHKRNDRKRRESECFNIVKCLLTACDSRTRNSAGKTALELAMERKFTSVVELLLSPDASLPPNVLLIVLRRCPSLEMVESLIQRGADVCSVTSSGDTALHLAISQYNADEETRCKLVKRLINAGCDTAAHNSAGETALEIAMKRNFTPVVELLLSPDASLPPNVLLIVLRRCLSLEMVESLIQRGADVCSVTSSGDTALHLAIDQYGYASEGTCYKLVKRLIDAGCETTMRNSTGETAVKLAIKRNLTSVVELLLPPNVPIPPDLLPFVLRQLHLTLEIVEILIQRGADVRSVTSSGDTALHLVISRYYYYASKETCHKLVKRLIHAGCDISTMRNSRGETVLELAIKRNLTSVVELLLSLSVLPPPNILLIALRQRSSLAMIESLIQRGADVCSIASSGDTALHLAINRYDYAGEGTCCKLVRRLIYAGCYTMARNSTGETALEMAMRHNFTSVVELMLSSDVPLSPDALPIAVWRGSTLEYIDGLIQRGADVGSVTSSGDTALHLAINGRYYYATQCKLVKRLIDAGCSTIARNSTGETALEIAMQHNFIAAVELLLPSDVPLPSDILLIALQQRSTLEMIKYLIRRGANVHSTTSDGGTALHLALAMHRTEEKCYEFAQCLINAGCNPSRCNLRGDTILLAAIRRGYSLVVDLLLSFDVSIPPDILHTALVGNHCKSDHLRMASHGSDHDLATQLQLPLATAYSGQGSQQVTKSPEPTRLKASRTCSSFQDESLETYMHVAKRRRLDEGEQPCIGITMAQFSGPSGGHYPMAL